MSGDSIAAVGNIHSHGGKIITGSPARSLEGQPVARVGDMVMCPKHGKQKIIAVIGCSRPQCEGRAVAHAGALTTCGAKILVSPTCYNTEGNADG